MKREVQFKAKLNTFPWARHAEYKSEVVWRLSCGVVWHSGGSCEVVWHGGGSNLEAAKVMHGGCEPEAQRE